MAKHDWKSGLLISFLAGVGAAGATFVLIELARRRNAGRPWPGRVGEARKQLASLERGSPRSRTRREKKAGRRLDAGVDRLRSAGL